MKARPMVAAGLVEPRVALGAGAQQANRAEHEARRRRSCPAPRAGPTTDTAPRGPKGNGTASPPRWRRSRAGSRRTSGGARPGARCSAACPRSCSRPRRRRDSAAWRLSCAALRWSAPSLAGAAMSRRKARTPTPIATNCEHESGAEQERHPVVRHQDVERARARSRRPNSAAGPSNTRKPSMNSATPISPAPAMARPLRRNNRRQRGGPGILRIRLATDFGQHRRHVHVERMRRRELAVVVASAAIVAEVGEVVEVAVGEGAPQLHGGEHRAQPLAIAARVADRHQPVGFGQRGGRDARRRRPRAG